MDLILHIPHIGLCLNTLVYGVMYRTSLRPVALLGGFVVI